MHVPDERLTPDQVPAGDAPWEAVAAFARRFHAYRVTGSVRRAADVAAEVHREFSESGELDRDLTTLRVALFLTVRAVDHEGGPDEDTRRFTGALVEAIRRRVEGGGDPGE